MLAVSFLRGSTKPSAFSEPSGLFFASFGWRHGEMSFCLVRSQLSPEMPQLHREVGLSCAFDPTTASRLYSLVNGAHIRFRRRISCFQPCNGRDGFPLRECYTASIHTHTHTHTRNPPRLKGSCSAQRQQHTVPLPLPLPAAGQQRADLSLRSLIKTDPVACTGDSVPRPTLRRQICQAPESGRKRVGGVVSYGTHYFGLYLWLFHAAAFASPCCLARERLRIACRILPACATIIGEDWRLQLAAS